MKFSLNYVMSINSPIFIIESNYKSINISLAGVMAHHYEIASGFTRELLENMKSKDERACCFGTQETCDNLSISVKDRVITFTADDIEI